MLDDTKVLHWLPDEDRWEDIPWDAWAAFRGIMAPSVGLPGISGGIHHFMVVVFDGDTPVNLISHKYLVESDGTVGDDNFGGLTREERDDYSRIMIARESTAEDTARLNSIRDKMGPAIEAPRESIAALRWALPKRPPDGSAAARYLRQFR